MASVDASAGAFRPNPDVVVRRLGETGVLVHLPSNRIFELNATGLRIWELAVQGLSRGAILARLQDEFDVGTNDAAMELDAFVRDLQQEQFLLA